jgi:hypothetical protein
MSKKKAARLESLQREYQRLSGSLAVNLRAKPARDLRVRIGHF